MLPIREYFKNPSKLILGITNKLYFLFSDKMSISIQYKIYMGRKLNLKNPKRYSEKLQWLKLYDRKLEYTNMVDKYEAKKYVADIIGEEYVIPTLGVWYNFDEIDFDELPAQFVLKTTNGGGGMGVVICKNKKEFDIDRARTVINRSLKQNIYNTLREWPYKNIHHRIIAEEYIGVGNDYIKDYKFFCFNGIPKVMLVANGRFVEHETYFDYFDMDFNHLPFEQDGPNYKKKIQKPIKFNLMKDIAEKLSKDLLHARIDLYEVNGNVKFGEITFFDSSGFAKFNPDEWDYKFGDMLKLPIDNK